jgi:hypothetical protein
MGSHYRQQPRPQLRYGRAGTPADGWARRPLDDEAPPSALSGETRTSCAAGSAVRDQRAGPPGRDPTRPRRALHPRPRPGRADGVFDQHDDARVRGFFRFAHIDGLITADPAVYARLPKVYFEESCTQGLDRLELIRFLQVATTITVHHGALAYLLGIKAFRASEAAAVRIEDYAETCAGTESCTWWARRDVGPRQLGRRIEPPER